MGTSATSTGLHSRLMDADQEGYDSTGHKVKEPEEKLDPTRFFKDADNKTIAYPVLYQNWAFILVAGGVACAWMMFSEGGYGYFNRATEDESVMEVLKAWVPENYIDSVKTAFSVYNFVSSNIIDPLATIIISANMMGMYRAIYRAGHSVKLTLSKKHGAEKVGYAVFAALIFIGLTTSFVFGSASPSVGLVDPNAKVLAFIKNNLKLICSLTFVGQLLTYFSFYAGNIFSAPDQITDLMKGKSNVIARVKASCQEDGCSKAFWFFARSILNVIQRPWSFGGISLAVSGSILNITSAQSIEDISLFSGAFWLYGAAVAGTILQTLVCQTQPDFSRTFPTIEERSKDKKQQQSAVNGQELGETASTATLSVSVRSDADEKRCDIKKLCNNPGQTLRAIGSGLATAALWVIAIDILLLRSTDNLVILTGKLTPEEMREPGNIALVVTGFVMTAISTYQYVNGNVLGGLPEATKEIVNFLSCNTLFKQESVSAGANGGKDEAHSEVNPLMRLGNDGMGESAV